MATKKSRKKLESEIQNQLDKLQKLQDALNERRDLDDKQMGVLVRNLWDVQSKDELQIFIESNKLDKLPKFKHYKEEEELKVEDKKSEDKSANADPKSSKTSDSSTTPAQKQSTNQPTVGVEQIAQKVHEQANKKTANQSTVGTQQSTYSISSSTYQPTNNR